MQCLSPVRLKLQGIVPCGKCLACLERRQRDWTFRLSIEHHQCTSCLFITLTYDEKHIPIVTHEDKVFGVLRKKDVQDFMKRLRFHISPHKVRFFACGEYGTKTLRPHYHVILFNFPTHYFDAYEVINKVWKNGFVVVKNAHSNHFHYVAKYCNSFTSLPRYLKFREWKPFILTSRRPALGLSYLTDAMVEYYRTTLSTVARFDGHIYSLPKYFRDKLFDDDMKAEIHDKIVDYINKNYEFEEKENRKKGRNLIAVLNLNSSRRTDFEERARRKAEKGRTL